MPIHQSIKNRGNGFSSFSTLVGKGMCEFSNASKLQASLLG